MKAVILARGLGRRMRSEAEDVVLSEQQQRVADAGIKTLIPIDGGRTLLEMIIANVVSAGFSDICLVIGPEHDAIRQFCAVNGLAVEFAVQDEARGTADAILATETFADDKLFLVVNSDNLYPVESLRRLRESNRSAMLAFNRNALVELSNIDTNRIASFATVEIDDDGNLTRIIEKPGRVEPESFVSMNAWLFSAEIFTACRAIKPSPERGEYEITAAVQFAVDKLGVKFAAIKTNEGVLDLSNRTDYQECRTDSCGRSQLMFIPGRIELLGKHTDYCGGRSLVCAIDRGFHADVEPGSDSLVVLENQDSSETVSLDLNDPTAKPGHWANYAVEVVRRLSANFPDHLKNGAVIRFHSNLPKAAGLSSSSALMIMIFAALDAVNGIRESDRYQENISNDLELAEYLGCIENGQSFRELAGSAGVGTFGGSQDHAAIILAKEGKLSRFSFSPLRHDADFPFPASHSFVIASSGVAAEKTGDARDRYNRVSRMVSEITSVLGKGLTLAEMIQQFGLDKVLASIREIKSEFTTRELLERVEQFRIENFEIIPAVSDLLAQGCLGDIGDAIDLSQENAERFLGNQIAETAFLQRSAREIGAVGASAFGAGFGGSVYAIVQASDADSFRNEWHRTYFKRFPEHKHSCEFFTTRPSQIVF